jgi:general secretion pathway protein D
LLDKPEMHRFCLVRSAFVPYAAALAAVLAFLVVAAPACAAVTVAAVRVDARPNGNAAVAVSFAGGIAPYQVVGAGTTEPSIVFTGAQLGPQVAPALAGAGPIASVTMSATGGAASITLHLTSPAQLAVRPGTNVVLVEVQGVAPGALLGALGALGPAPLAATPLGAVTEVVPLKYADVSEIAGVLVAGSTVTSNDTFTPIQTNIGTSSLTGSSFGGITGGLQSTPAVQTFGGTFGQPQGLAQRVDDNVAIDRRLNAIILSGTPEMVASLKAIIEKIDVPVPSVILETQIVELTNSAARNIGLDFSPDGTGTVVNGSGRSGVGSSATGNGYTLATQNSGSGAATIQANLYAQIQLGNGKVIAKPRILAQSGQQASILTGDAIPIVTNVVVAGAGAVSSQQVNYVNVGVNLQIQPRVSSDGYVTSHIYSEVSSVTSFNSIGAPQISQRTASTLATVRDGDSFVIGGLLQDNETRSLSKLPFIGDIPLIGLFFQHVNTSHTQTNLYIVVTPHVVVPGGLSPPVGPLVAPSALPQLGPPAGPGAPAAGVPLVAPSPMSTAGPHR